MQWERDVSKQITVNTGESVPEQGGTGALEALWSLASLFLFFYTPFKRFFLDSWHSKLLFILQSPAHMFPLP